MIPPNSQNLAAESEQQRISDLYEKFKYILLHYALSITKSQELAEDAIHAMFLTVIKNKKKYLSLTEDEFKRFAIISVKNKCIDLLRVENKYCGISDNLLADIVDPTDISVEERVVNSVYHNGIREYISALDPIGWQMLEMKYVLGMTYREISEELGMTEKNVDTKIMRTKAKARKFLLNNPDFMEK